MTNPTPLSPAAQAVLDAYADANWGAELTNSDRRGLAAALRAAAEGVREAYVNDVDFHSADQWLDAIAAELDGTQPFSESD